MKRMKKNRISRMTAVFCAVLVATVMLSGCVTRINPEPTVLEPVKYVYVKDGDTIGVTGMDGESFTVRLIGIDAPESVAPESYSEKTGKENSEYGEMSAEHLTLMLKDCDLLFLEGKINEDTNRPYGCDGRNFRSFFQVSPSCGRFQARGI